MAIKRKAKDPKSIVPEYIQTAGIMQRRKVTKRKLPTFSEAMLLLHAPEALRLYWEALFVGLKNGDRAALDAVGEIFNYTKGKGFNLTLTQQLLQQNAVAGPESVVKGFDAFTRELAEARAGRALPAPVEVIDVHPVDTPPAA